LEVLGYGNGASFDPDQRPFYPDKSPFSPDEGSFYPDGASFSQDGALRIDSEVGFIDLFAGLVQTKPQADKKDS
jgi:hypothetical protein